MNKTIIGISGKKRAGKDTTAKVLQETLPNAIILYFANTLKKVAAVALGYQYDHFFKDENKFKEYEIAPGVTMTGREFLQKVGTESFRDNIHKDFWVHSLMKQIEYLPENIEYVIIPDVRFENEYEAILERNGYVIRVVRSGLESDDHTSETALDNYRFHARIYNNEGYMGEKFLENVKKFAEAFKKIKNEKNTEISE